MKTEFTVAGIDFGSKLSGFTVIAWLEPHSLNVRWKQSQRKKSADTFLQEVILDAKPYIIGIDAPLSLPGIYRWPDKYSDYFYRKADRLAGAMSPMFIGGLTARAIKLKDHLTISDQIEVKEVYPKLMADEWNLQSYGYRKKDGALRKVLDQVIAHTAWNLPETPANWHHVDALLALASTVRILNNEAVTIGDETEGAIMY